MGLIKLMQAIMGVETPQKRSKAKRVAVVYAIGPIMSGKSQSSLFGGQTMGSDTIVKALREAAEDEKVAAIVLRINSPGGSALASDMIWRATQAIEKPVVVSMSDVAASGGYYIAMGCDKIYAEPSTITGSIGVVGGKMALRGLYKKLGVSTSVITRGKNAALFSATDKWNPSERAAIERLMEDVYKQFTTKVAKGRHMPLERVLELAGGRVYTGRDAKQIGLVDELGTLHDAIAGAKSLAGIGKGQKVELKILPKPSSFFETLFGDMEEEYEAQMAKAFGLPAAGLVRELPSEMTAPLRKAVQLQIMLRDRISLVMPFDLEVR
jgi:protease-4